MRVIQKLFTLIDKLNSEIFAEELYRTEGMSEERVKERMRDVNRYIEKLKVGDVE